MKKILCVLGIICVFITTIIAYIVIEIKVSEKKYYEALINIPTKHYIEEDLEIVFITTGVSVLEYEVEDEIIIYTVMVENDKYLALYQIKRKNGILYNDYCWEYVSNRLLVKGE